MSTRIHKYTTVNNKQCLYDIIIFKVDNMYCDVLFVGLNFCFFGLVSPNDDVMYAQDSL